MADAHDRGRGLPRPQQWPRITATTAVHEWSRITATTAVVVADYRDHSVDVDICEHACGFIL